jgi:hypothetical protein
MSQDDRFEDFVRSSIRDVDPVDEIPREEMWSRISEARRFQRARRVPTFPVWAQWGVGLAAAMVIGIGLGRWSAVSRAGSNDTPVVATAPDSLTRLANAAAAFIESASPYRVAALRHLGSAEVLLTSVNSGTVDPQLKFWAKDMLSSTRYLMDSPESDDPRIASLLADLELILAQIASSSHNVKKSELDLIQDGIKHTSVLPRLRATQSAHSAVAGT